MTLILFDIDGTLIQANGAGRTALRRALSSWADRPVSTDGVAFSGRTDPDIIASVLERNGLATTDDTVDEALLAYVQTVTGTLSPDNVDLLPGVDDLLGVLDDHASIQLGLITGNVEPVAYEKIGTHDLAAYFPFGAFGSDHADRNELVPIALRRARSHVGEPLPSGETIVIVGDTVHDISCARGAGARAVAVATGRYERHELAKQNPDVLLDTLEDTSQVVSAIRPD